MTEAQLYAQAEKLVKALPGGTKFCITDQNGTIIERHHPSRIRALRKAVKLLDEGRI